MLFIEKETGNIYEMLCSDFGDYQMTIDTPSERRTPHFTIFNSKTYYFSIDRVHLMGDEIGPSFTQGEFADFFEFLGFV